MKVTLDELRTVIECSSSMAQAASKLGLHQATLKRYAVDHGLYKTNQGGCGISKNRKPTILLEDILDGKHPEYQTYKLKLRLYKEGIKKNECEICKISEWNGKMLQCELDHIDGNKYNHNLDNLRVICPNCHSQTSTFRFKRGKE